jgi:orotidine-5'-phosphate decarboxylase
MASLSKLPFSERAVAHPHPLAKRLFQLPETKKSNLVISADLTDSESLLACADS